MHLDTAKVVKQGLLFVLILSISLTIKKNINYRVAKKHAPSSSKQSTICSSCEKEFSSYNLLQKHRGKAHGAKQRKPSVAVADLNKIVEQEGEDGEKIKE